MEEVKRLFQVAAEDPKIASYEADEDGENGEYVNFLFKTNCLAELWEFMRDFLYESPIFGELLSQATIVTCEGENGWDDYLLLHHFDRLVQTDKLSNP
jgi:hypothetical protein